MTLLLLLAACNGDPAGPGPDPTLDSDGDGLSDYAERVGWTVTVDVAGTGAADPTTLELREVTSDPNNADSDGDGLTDALEFEALTDPTAQDTDGDGLSDREEVIRWLTSPLSVDADADGLFDGAELMLEGDVPGPDATAPWLADTDGDGVSDGDERDLGTDPRIAELPWLRLNVDLLAVEVTVDGIFQGEPATDTVTGALHGDGVLGLGSVSDDAGGLAGTLVQRLPVSAADGAGMQTAHTTVQTLLRARQQAVGTARVFAEVELDNPHDSGTWTTQRPAMVLSGGVLEDSIILVADGDHVIAPASRERTTVSADVELDVALELLRNPEELTLTWTDADQLRLDGDNAFDRLHTIEERTARIGSDVGDGLPFVARLAVGIDRNDGGTPVPVPLDEALTRIGRTVSVASDGEIIDLDGFRAALHDGDAPELDDPDHLPTEQPGERLLAAWWDGVVPDVLPGDAVALIYLQDADRDGLDDRFEAVLGATDSTIRSDGDGLSDWFETQIGWEIGVLTTDGAVFRRVYPSPVLDDTDGDGISDEDEYWDGTDPRAADTDGDNNPDGTDPVPLAYNVSGPDLSGLTLTQPALGDTWRVAGPVVDDEGDVVEVLIEWGDGTWDVRYSGFDDVFVQRTYPLAGAYTVTVTATDAVGQQTVWTREAIAYRVPPDAPAFADDCGNPGGAAAGNTWCQSPGYRTGVPELGPNNTIAGWWRFGRVPGVWSDSWLQSFADAWLLGELGYPALFMNECAGFDDCDHPVTFGFRGTLPPPGLHEVSTAILPRNEWHYVAATLQDLGDGTSEMTIYWGQSVPLESRSVVVAGVEPTTDNCGVTFWSYSPQDVVDVANGPRHCDTVYDGGRPWNNFTAGPQADNMRIWHRALNEYEINALVLP